MGEKQGLFSVHAAGNGTNKMVGQTKGLRLF